MVRLAEQSTATNPAAERRFDSKVIFAFIGGAIVLLLVFFFVFSRWAPYSKTVNTESNTSRTQEDDKRAVIGRQRSINSEG